MAGIDGPGPESAQRVRDPRGPLREAAGVRPGPEDLTARGGQHLATGLAERRRERRDGPALGSEAGGEDGRRGLDEVQPEVVHGRADGGPDDEPDAAELVPGARRGVVAPGAVHD